MSVFDVVLGLSTVVLALLLAALATELWQMFPERPTLVRLLSVFVALSAVSRATEAVQVLSLSRITTPYDELTLIVRTIQILVVGYALFWHFRRQYHESGGYLESYYRERRKREGG